MTQRIHVIGGGTFSYVRNHLALAAPAFGSTASTINTMLLDEIGYNPALPQATRDMKVHLHLTKMADPSSEIVTNQDVAALLETLKADPETRVIILNAALCDYDGSVVTSYITENGKDGWGPTPSGSHEPRLKSRSGEQQMMLTPAAKLVGDIRKERKDIFVVAFKTTTGETSDEQYKIALNALKRDSSNLVLANDTVTRNNMIVAPEETRYHETTDRLKALRGLVEMVLARSSNTFTRSTVVDGPSVAWNDERVPSNLRAVVDHCISQGAYKPFRGVTAGHFAVRLDEGRILTSKRKRDFNSLNTEGLVLVEYEGDDKVIAHGAKPSVGGQSQRIVFREHPDLDCIVHFHCPVKPKAAYGIKHAPQWQNECGSHQCGANTSRNLRDHGVVKAVMLDGHGPNIVFSRDTPAEKVIAFIDANFDLSAKTGGMVG